MPLVDYGPVKPPSAVIELPPHFSWSSLSSWVECGERWRLTRGHHYPEATWYATLAGSAVHSITEIIDKATFNGADLDEAELTAPNFKDVFVQNIENAKKRGKEIKASGRVLKSHGKGGGPNKKDAAWWLVEGQAMINRWVNRRRAFTDWHIMRMPDGTPGVEVEVRVDFGGVEILGAIDRVMVDPDGRAAIVDLKTGAVPVGVLQMATYGLALRILHGIGASVAYYWSPDSKDAYGRMIGPFDLTAFDADRIEHMYRGARRGIEEGIFIPHVTGMCSGCPVKDQCWAYNPGRNITSPVVSPVIVKG